MDKKSVMIAAFLSGVAALIYEIAWIRPLQFVFGSTIYTTSIIFGAFMIGLGIGSLITPQFFDKTEIAFAWVEIAIGLFGILFFYILNIFF